jgi:hypothetical protein
MADTRLTKIGFLRALKLCAFGILSPQKLVEAEVSDEKVRKTFSQPPPGPAPRAMKLRRAFWVSFILVLCSVVLGYAAGKIAAAVSGITTSRLIGVLQIIGATLLLWATLFIRGWDIQTIGGVTLTERVNQWIYRFLYCLGTAVVVASLALADSNP